jgi:hypothetical protein
MNVLARIEEIVKKAVDAGEPTLPRSLVSKVTVLLREQVDSHDERARVVAEASETFAKRYAAQLQAALERSAADAPQPTPPPAIARPERAASTSARTSAPKKPSEPRGTRGVTTRHLDPRQLSSVPNGLRVFYQGVGATIENAALVLDDGRSFDAPTPAAMWVSRGEHVNGWSVWKVADGRSLQECWDSGQDWPSID